MLSNECKCTVVVPVTEPRVGVVPIVSMSRRSVHVVLGETVWIAKEFCGGLAGRAWGSVPGGYVVRFHRDMLGVVKDS